MPRQSGKEGAKDIPSWARAKGGQPKPEENGRAFAKRMMDDQYGPGNWKDTGSEYQQLKKFGDRHWKIEHGLLPLGDDDDYNDDEAEVSDD